MYISIHSSSSVRMRSNPANNFGCDDVNVLHTGRAGRRHCAVGGTIGVLPPTAVTTQH